MILRAKIHRPVRPCVYTMINFAYYMITGYKHSVTGCGSQRSHVVVPQRKLMLTVVFVEHHTPLHVYVSHRSQIQFEDEDHTIHNSVRGVTTTRLCLEPQLVTLCLYPVMIKDVYLWQLPLSYCRLFSPPLIMAEKKLTVNTVTKMRIDTKIARSKMKAHSSYVYTTSTVVYTSCLSLVDNAFAFPSC